MGHIQMTSIEMKEYLKRLSVKNIDDWEQRAVIKSAYTAIYETSKKYGLSPHFRIFQVNHPPFYPPFQLID